MTAGIDREGAKMAQAGGTRKFPEWLGLLIFTLMAVALAVAFLIGSSALEGRPGRFPFAVAIITIVLGLIELARQVVAIRTGAPEAADADAETAGAEASAWTERVGVVTWFALTVAGVLVAGVLPTAFVSGTAYYRWIDGRGIAVSLVAGAVLAGGLWVVFELLAGFTLYGGLMR